MNANSKVDTRVIRAQTRLLKRYSELRQMGGWRVLADEISRDVGLRVNQRYVWEFCRNGILPSNLDVREALLDWRPNGGSSMTGKSVYEQILADLAAGEMTSLQREIFAALRRAYPSSLSRQQLVKMIHGYEPQDINNDAGDRKNRKAIQALRDQMIPIASSSGEAGYRLDVSEPVIRRMIAEWESRRRELHLRVRRAEELLVKIHRLGLAAIPSELPPAVKKPVQPRLI